MSRYAARGGPQIPSIADRSAPRNTAEERAASQSRTQGSRSQANCRSTKTQVNPNSALKGTKHHRSDPSNVPGILGSSYL